MGETDVIFDLLFVKSDKKTSIKKTRHEKKIQYEKIKKENHKKFFKGRILKKNRSKSFAESSKKMARHIFDRSYE